MVALVVAADVRRRSGAEFDRWWCDLFVLKCRALVRRRPLEAAKAWAGNGAITRDSDKQPAMMASADKRSDWPHMAQTIRNEHLLCRSISLLNG